MNTRPPYPTDLTNAQWARLAPLVPAQQERGRPLKYARREILNALLYMAHTGCQWRCLPHDFPRRGAVRYYFDRWTADGTLERLHTALREQVRTAAGRDPQPRAGIVASQTVKTGRQPGVRGDDGAKRTTGRKRHLLVDTQGLLLAVLVTAANISDPAGARLLFSAAHPGLPRLQHIWADSIYGGTLVAWAAACWGGGDCAPSGHRP
jgi:putative transposase